MLPIQRDESGEFTGIFTVTLEQPGRPVVVLDHPLIQALEATLRSVPRDARGLVLRSGSERVFVAGADLKTIVEWNDSRLHAYLEMGARVFGMLCSFPFPTAAAINGAALGGGLEIAMHCDGMVAAPSASGKRYQVGLPEAGLGLCPGWGGTNMLPARMRDAAEAITRTATGKTMTDEEAAAAGVFDDVAERADDLLPAAKRWILRRQREGPIKRDGGPAKWIGRGEHAARVLAGLDAVRADLPETPAAKAVAEAVDTGLARGWRAACQTERDHLVRLRHTPLAKQAIESFFAKSAKG